jgi:RNA polymerase primary sigma factor
MSYNGESDFTLYDLIQSDNEPTPDNDLLDQSTKQDLFRAINKLNKRENDILTLTYGLNNNKVCSLNEIAEIMQLTNERIRQIRSKSLIKLKKIMLGNSLFQSNI